MLRRVLTTLFLTLSVPHTSHGTSPEDWSPEGLWRDWPTTRFVAVEAPCLTPERLTEELRRLATEHPDSLEITRRGTSVEGRPIHLLKLGRGERRVLLWSQMHGDEATATPALLDLTNALLSSSSEESRRILDELELFVVPMLNPDGAARWSRRNAYDIDLNRDALALATPEARLLKELRDELEPMLGFNLHDQERRILAGDTGSLATLSLLGVAGDPQGTLTPARERAMRAAAAVVAATTAWIGDGIGRYDEDWNPRAFGDNITRWGTPVLLVESGGLDPDRPASDLVRLNFVALAHVLSELARNDLADHAIERYRTLPRNLRNGYSDLVVSGGDLWHAESDTRFRADLAIDVLRPDLDPEGCAERIAGPRRDRRSTVVEIGDASTRIGGRTLDASGRLLVPALEVEIEGIESWSWLEVQVDTLGRLGVGTIHWRVADDDLATARDRAAASAGAPRLLVTATPSGAPRLDERARAVPDRPTLGALIRALGLDPQQTLGALGSLRRGQSASLLLLDADGGPSLDAPVRGLVLDGRVVTP